MISTEVETVVKSHVFIHIYTGMNILMRVNYSDIILT